jgi:hypothetical protein
LAVSEWRNAYGVFCFDLEIESSLSGRVLPDFEEAMNGFGEFAIKGSNASERYLDQPVPA